MSATVPPPRLESSLRLLLAGAALGTKPESFLDRGPVPASNTYGAIQMKTCRVEDDLVRELGALNSKLNRLSPSWVHDEQQREQIQERRETLQIEIKRHRAKGHDGQRCPSFDLRKAAFYTSR